MSAAETRDQLVERVRQAIDAAEKDAERRWWGCSGHDPERDAFDDRDRMAEKERRASVARAEAAIAELYEEGL